MDQEGAADELVAHMGAVVVAHGRADLALDCIRTLPALPRERIVVVINAPDLANPYELAELRQTATVVAPDKPQGYGANLNLGARSRFAPYPCGLSGATTVAVCRSSASSYGFARSGALITTTIRSRGSAGSVRMQSSARSARPCATTTAPM